MLPGRLCDCDTLKELIALVVSGTCDEFPFDVIHECLFTRDDVMLVADVCKWKAVAGMVESARSLVFHK